MGEKDRMTALFEAQRAASREGPGPSLAQRIGRLDRAIGLLVDHKESLTAAMAADFGHRSLEQSLMTDILASVERLKYARRHVKRWMKARPRGVEFPLNLLGARSHLQPQPKGVVGIISPWNFPVYLAFAPLAGALAAGNRVMLKPSEATPATSALLGELISTVYEESEVAVIQGGAQIAAAFSALPFDHLVFTGSTATGRKVMQAAAANLTPVTLELGGKSPAIVSADSDLAYAARRIMGGKLMNAGQICIAPDYVFVPAAEMDHFLDAARAAVAQMYPTLKDNPDYTSVINDHHDNRLRSLLEEAVDRGCRLVEINPAKEDFAGDTGHRLPPVLVLDPDDDLAIMREEIFGPLLPVKPYRSLDEVIAFINERDRPLSLYYFGDDVEGRNRLLNETVSGGVTLDDVIWHSGVGDLPFGGIGASGMGAYNGREGFDTFSHLKPVLKQPRSKLLDMLWPPYGARFRKVVGSRVKR